MSLVNADRNLLLGILAHQNAFITMDQLPQHVSLLYDKTKADGNSANKGSTRLCRVLLDGSRIGTSSSTQAI